MNRLIIIQIILFLLNFCIVMAKVQHSALTTERTSFNPILNKAQLIAYRKELATRTFTLKEFIEFLELPYVNEEFQFEHINIMADPDNEEVIITRCRAGSKTFDVICVLLWFAYHGYNTIFFVAQQRQATQPKKYLKSLLNNSFLNYATDDILKESVTFKNGGDLQIINLTEHNARGLRGDVIYYDEVALADEMAYNASEPILNNSPLHKQIYGSTPQKGTLYEKILKRLEKEGSPCLFRKIEDIKRFADKPGYIEKLKRKYKDMMWFYRQEYECSLESPAGKVFHNYIEGDFTELLSSQKTNYQKHFQHFGIDWNPRDGHYMAGSRWADDYSSNLVLYEENLGTDQDRAIEKAIQILINNPNSKCELEDGGTNMGYCDAFMSHIYKLCKKDPKYNFLKKNVYRRPWDTMGKNKMKSITCLTDKIIYINRVLTEGIYDWVDKACWDPEATDSPKLEKDPEQHPLDAYLHSAWAGFCA